MAAESTTSPIVITGGAQRLGLAAALALREDNYPVVITYRKTRATLDVLRQKGIETVKADFNDDGYREKALKKSLLGIAPGKAEGVNAVRYILESSYLTGKTIALDGGRHLAQAG